MALGTSLGVSPVCNFHEFIAEPGNVLDRTQSLCNEANMFCQESIELAAPFIPWSRDDSVTVSSMMKINFR